MKVPGRVSMLGGNLAVSLSINLTRTFSEQQEFTGLLILEI